MRSDFAICAIVRAHIAAANVKELPHAQRSEKCVLRNRLSRTTKAVQTASFEQRRPNTYYTIVARFLESLKPRDFVERMLVKDLTDSTWEMMRYSNHKTLAIERQHHLNLKIQGTLRELKEKEKAAIANCDGKTETVTAESHPKREKTAEQRGETKEDELGEQAGAATSQNEGCADELDHAKALEGRIEYFEQLDRLMRVQVARRNDALEQIEFYRRGLGQHLLQISDDIIDGDCSETRHEPPSIAGPGDGAQ